MKSECDNPKPSTSKATPPCDLDQSSDINNLPTPSPEPKNTRHNTASNSKPTKNKNPKTGDVEHDLLNTMKETMNSLGEVFAKRKSATNLPEKVQDPKSPDIHDMWSKLLATKVRKMDESVIDDFKLEVDTLANTYMKK